MEPQGKLWGWIPYDFRVPTWNRIRDRIWNPEDRRIIVPRAFGIGWSINLYQLRAKYPPLFYVLVAVVLLSLLGKIRKLGKKK